MGMLKDLWKRWDERYAALSQRERALVAAVLIGGIGMVVSTLAVEPQFVRASIAKKNLELQQADSDRFKAQMNSLQARLKEDPDANARRELAVLKQRLETLNGDLAKANEALVPAAEMNARLERILARQPGLRLVSLRTMPPSSFVDVKAGGGGEEGKAKAADKSGTAEKAKEKPGGDFDLYRHGVEIKLAGSYSDLYAYVAQLEGDKQKFIWGEIKLSVVEYPKAEMTIVLYTLSTEKAWLSI